MATRPGINGDQDDTAPAGDSDEFDAAFDEIASPQDEQPDSDPAGPAKDGDPVDDDQHDEPQPDADAAPGKDTPAAATPPAGQTDDPFADATPAQKAYLANLQRDYDHRLRSSNGRVSALDRELARLRGSQPAPEAPAPKDDKAKPGTDPAASDLLGSDDFKAFEEEFPEIATPLKGVISRLETRLAAAEGTVGTVQDDRTAAALAANEQALTAAHPDWLDIAKDDRFAGWADTQPKAIRDAIARNWEGIVDPEDAGLVFERFKAQMGAPAPTPSPSPAPTAAPAPLDAKRQRQLATGRDARAKTPSTTGDEPDDFDTAFDSATRKIDRERESRYGTRNR